MEYVWSLWETIKYYLFWVTQPQEIDTPISPLSPREPIHEDDVDLRLTKDVDLRQHLTKVIYYYHPDKKTS